MPFTAPALLTFLFVKDRHSWYRLERDLVYDFKEGGFEIHIVVPKGTITDKGSQPPILRPLFPSDDEGTPWYIVHDYTYSLKNVPRFLADAILRQGLAVVGYGWFRRVAIFWAVRLFGHSHKSRPQLSTPTTKRGFP